KYTVLVVCCLGSLVANACVSVIADELNEEINLSDIQPPFSFSKFCKSVSGDLWRVGGNGQILKIDRGGKSRLLRVTDTDFSAVHFVNGNTGWIVGANGAIFFTVDAGENWTKQNSESKDDLKAIFCLSANLCWAVGDNGAILRTR